jgi:5-(carboxyamino)imidazole ribonucleotide synthase
MKTLAPGSIIGIIGGGQLGRMLALAAAPLGYRIHVYAPDAAPCAGEVAWKVTQAAYDDAAALATFAAEVDVVTFEFENIAVAPLSALGDVPFFPPLKALEIGQDRAAEKRFAEGLGARTARWAEVADRSALAAALATVGTPAILKTTRLGYDGKGQARLTTPDEADTAWASLGGQPAILEAMVSFDHEFSLIVARGQDGQLAIYDAPDNVHVGGVLDTSTVPAGAVVQAQVAQAHVLAHRIAEALDYVGVFAIEFFASAEGPVFNEMAPRVHNSGHWTIEGAETSQFENHIRAICGLPLGSVALTGNQVVMTNLIGDTVHHWPAFMAENRAHLHLYGKGAPSPGRKMGHVTRVQR